MPFDELRAVVPTQGMLKSFRLRKAFCALLATKQRHGYVGILESERLGKDDEKMMKGAGRNFDTERYFACAAHTDAEGLSMSINS